MNELLQKGATLYKLEGKNTIVSSGCILHPIIDSSIKTPRFRILTHREGELDVRKLHHWSVVTLKETHQCLGLFMLIESG